MKKDAFSQLHPAVEFLFFLLAIGFGVAIRHPLYILAGCVCGGGYLLFLRGRRAVRFLAGGMAVFILLSAINPLFSVYGETVLFTVFGRPYTWQALRYGMAVSGIFVVMLFWFACYSQVLTGDKFTALFGSVIPGLSLLLVMVLRMIPNLIRKAKQISAARRCIGGGNEQAARKAQLAEGMARLSALTDWALEGSITTADSMRARGYGTAKRTGFRRWQMTPTDWTVLVLILLLAASVLAAGGWQAVYEPQLLIQRPTWGLAAYWALLSLPSLLHIKEALLWRIFISRI